MRLPTQEPQETQVQSLGQEDPLEKEMATHSSILAWIIPQIEGCKESDMTEHTLARSKVGPGHPILTTLQSILQSILL